jgi:hypothetical protein
LPGTKADTPVSGIGLRISLDVTGTGPVAVSFLTTLEGAINARAVAEEKCRILED